jgi:hypothetical protein
MPVDTHEELVGRVLRGVDHVEPRMSKSEIEWLRGKLKYNEPALRSRLEALYDVLPGAAKAALPSRSQFARETAATRHHMTHWAEDKQPGVLEGGRALLRGIYQLRLVVKCVFLLEMGIGDDRTVAQLPEIRTLRLWQNTA